MVLILYWILSLFKKNLFYYSSIADFLCCGSSRCIAKWLSYMHTHIFFFRFFSLIGYYKIIEYIVPWGKQSRAIQVEKVKSSYLKGPNYFLSKNRLQRFFPPFKKQVLQSAAASCFRVRRAVRNHLVQVSSFFRWGTLVQRNCFFFPKPKSHGLLET